VPSPVYRAAVTAGVLAVAAMLPTASADAAPRGTCGLRVDRPHSSWEVPAQIHTRVESSCRVLPVQSNQVVARTYRARWFGWQFVKEQSFGPRASDKIFVVVDVDCSPGTSDRWRTVATGTALIAGERHTATVYEQTDSAIPCRT
jgi:hypothetical protein